MTTSIVKKLITMWRRGRAWSKLVYNGVMLAARMSPFATESREFASAW